MSPAQVLIVGAGFSGTMVAANLARLGVRSTIVDTADRAGKGVAYSTTDPSHRLNVPAYKMSAWPDAPDDFASYAASRDVKADQFAPRETFGEYLRSQLDEAIKTGLVYLLAGQVEKVWRNPSGLWEASPHPVLV